MPLVVEEDEALDLLRIGLFSFHTQVLEPGH
jgi:hypothetical protein